MKAHIDRFSTLGGVIIVVGWSSDYTPEKPLELAAWATKAPAYPRARTRGVWIIL